MAIPYVLILFCDLKKDGFICYLTIAVKNE